MAGEYVEVSGYSQADIDDAIRQATEEASTTIVGGTNTTEAQVLSGQIFASVPLSNDTYKKTGTMPNNGAVNATINPGTQYTIPAGYHNGSGIVKANANQNTDVFTPVERRVNIDMGENNAYRYVTTTQVPNSNSGIYEAPTPANSTVNANTFDMGETNAFRYVRTKNAYDKGYGDGYYNGHADWENYISADNTYSNWWYPSAGNTGSWSVGITRHGIYLITMHAARFTSSADSEPGFTDISVSGGTLLRTIVNSTVTHKPSSSAPERAHSTLVTIMVKVAAGATLGWSAKVTKACDVRILGYMLG